MQTAPHDATKSTKGRFLRQTEPSVCIFNSFVCAFVCHLCPIVGKGKKAKGFTLLEMVITVAILAILTTVAIPGFQTVIRNSRLITQANELLADLSLARTEAIKRSGYAGGSAGVCASSDGITCAGAWNQGRIVFATDPGGATVVLRAREAVSGNNNVTTNGGTIITFSGPYATVTPPPAQPITFTVCDSGGAAGRQLSISAAGKTTTNTTALTSC